MRTLFRTFTSCLIIVWLTIINCFAQAPVSIFDPSGGAPTCTNIPTTYSLVTTSSSTNLQGCNTEWTIIGGRDAVSGQTTVRGVNNITVIWNDVPTTVSNGVYSSSLKAITSQCSNSAINYTTPLNVVTRSLAQSVVGPISLNGTVFNGQVPFGDNAQLTLTVPQVRLPYPSSVSNVDYAGAYEWTLPNG